MNFFSRSSITVICGVFLAIFIGHSSALADNGFATTSSNWSGYVAQSGSYTGVSGTWTVPALTYSPTLASNATWVGIGGRASGDLIQAGIYEIADSQGASYQAWYELLPDNSTPVSLTVHPGDSISVAILEVSSDTWNVVITNNTTAQQVEKTVNYQSSLSSVEWIQERPLINGSLSTLSGYTPVQFTGATAIQNGARLTLAQTNAQTISLLDESTNTALAVPSPISSDGMSFTDYRTSATASPDDDISSRHIGWMTVPQTQQPGIGWIIVHY
jgi:hypothetical protein